MSRRSVGIRSLWVAAGFIATVAVDGGCSRPAAPGAPSYDPLAEAVASAGKARNLEAGVPPQCYTKTGNESNPCWTCHTRPVGENYRTDWPLQSEYAFSDQALENHWTNLFRDRRPAVDAIPDDEILRYVRQDNYQPLRQALAERVDYPGYRPDLDIHGGFDDDGFARDGSGWRALRYQPFPGAFWPTNGSTDDVFVRLPRAFRTIGGQQSGAVYRLNLAILEAAIAGDPTAAPDRLGRQVEPVDERLASFDLDGDGAISAGITVINRLPPTYAGDAAAQPVRQYVYPRGTELLHSVRYLDPDALSFTARRMKELRYARKVEEPDDWGTLAAYENEDEEKDEGRFPVYRGSPAVGLLNAFGWQLQGFIEDRQGRLRLQTEEEHRFCMGCHSGIGVTVNQTFSVARKLPGLAGWKAQDLRGLRDRPQAGHLEGEVLTYLRRVGGGDELRANGEMIARFVPGGVVNVAEVRRAAPGGDRDLTHLLLPSRARALALDKAYRVIVEEQSFDRGRDPVVAPAVNVHRTLANGATELGAAGRVYRDGRLHLDWTDD